MQENSADDTVPKGNGISPDEPDHIKTEEQKSADPPLKEENVSGVDSSDNKKSMAGGKESVEDAAESLPTTPQNGQLPPKHPNDKSKTNKLSSPPPNHDPSVDISSSGAEKSSADNFGENPMSNRSSETKPPRRESDHAPSSPSWGGWFGSMLNEQTLVSGASSIMNTIKNEASAVAKDVGKVITDTKAELVEDFQGMRKDLAAAFADPGADAKPLTDSSDMVKAATRLDAIEKRTRRMGDAVDDLLNFRSILNTKYRNLGQIFGKVKMGRKTICDACKHVGEEFDNVASWGVNTQDATFSDRVLAPCKIILERCQICRDVLTLYQEAKMTFSQIDISWRRRGEEIEENPGLLETRDAELADAKKQVTQFETDFVEAVKGLQIYVETEVAESFNGVSLIPSVPMEDLDEDLIAALAEDEEDVEIEAE